MALVRIAPLLALLAALPAGASSAARGAAPCAGGVFELDAAAGPLVPGGGAVPDLVLVGDDGAVSIASGCLKVPGKLKSSRKGTRLSARWTPRTGLCAGLDRKASLRARFDASCGSLAGRFVTKGRKVAFTATRAGVELAGHVPAALFGERLVVAHASGEEMLAADASWADAFAALGASAGEVEVATAVPRPDSSLDLRAAAWTAPGAGFAQRVADLAAAIAAHPAAGYAAEERTLGGRSVWKVTMPADAEAPAVYYAVDGETLLLLVSADEALVGDVLGALPEAAPLARDAHAAPVARVARGGEPPAPGAFPLVLHLLLPVTQPVCVSEPAGRVTLDLTVLDGYYQIPLPVFFTVLSQQIGATSPAVCYGPACSFFYRALRFESQEQVTVQATAPAGGLGVLPFSFPVRHCLNGTWQDGDREVEVQQVRDHLVARLSSGDICGEPGGNDFTGDVTDPERFAGDDLKVCNPEQCVQAGLREPSALVPYTAVVAEDGGSAEISWQSTQFDLVYDDHGRLVGCPPNGDVEARSFTIERLKFGPSVP